MSEDVKGTGAVMDAEANVIPDRTPDDDMREDRIHGPFATADELLTALKRTPLDMADERIKELQQQLTEAHRRIALLVLAGDELYDYVSDSPCECSSECNHCKRIMATWQQVAKGEGTGS